MGERKPYTYGQLNAKQDGYPKQKQLFGFQHVPKKGLYPEEKFNAQHWTPKENNCQRWKRPGYLTCKAHNGRSDHFRKHHTIQLLKAASTLRTKTKRRDFQSDSKLKYESRPNVMQKVSAFGPAHAAEYARKFCQHKDTL